MKLLSIIALSLITQIANAQTSNKMKLNAGIITEKLQETKEFYINTLDFGITFENDFYILMHTPDKAFELSFLMSNHPSQQPLFQQAFVGKGVFLTIEVDNVDAIYTKLKEKQVPIEIELRDEPWGDRHFAIDARPKNK